MITAQLLHEFAVYSDGGISASGLRVGRVLTNYERFGMSRPTQNGANKDIQGLPDTVKLADPKPVTLSEASQLFWFGELVRARPEWSHSQLITAWRSLTISGRAFTDRVSWSNGYADYVQGINLNAEPMKFVPIITGGNVVELLGDPVSFGGALCWPIRCFDPVSHTGTIFRATISRREGYQALTKTWAREDIEIDFGQLGGVPVPVPLFSKGGVGLIAFDRVKEISA